MSVEKLCVLVSSDSVSHVLAGDMQRNKWNTGNVLAWPTDKTGVVPDDHALILLSELADKHVINAFKKTDQGLMKLSSHFLNAEDSAIDALHDVMMQHDPAYFDALSEEELEVISAEQGVDTPGFVFEAVKQSVIQVPLWTPEHAKAALDNGIADDFEVLTLQQFLIRNSGLIESVYPGATQAPIMLSPSQIAAITPYLDADGMEPHQRILKVKTELATRGLKLAEHDLDRLMRHGPDKFRIDINPQDRADELIAQAQKYSSLSELGYRCADHIMNHNTRSAYHAVAQIVQQKAMTSSNYLDDTNALVGYMFYHLDGYTPPGSQSSYVQEFIRHQQDYHEPKLNAYLDRMGLEGHYLDRVGAALAYVKFDDAVTAALSPEKAIAEKSQDLIKGLMACSNTFSMSTFLLANSQAMAKVQAEAGNALLEKLADQAALPAVNVGGPGQRLR